MPLKFMGGRLDEMMDKQTLTEHYSTPFRSGLASEARLNYWSILEERLVPLYSTMVIIHMCASSLLSNFTQSTSCGAFCAEFVLGDIIYFPPLYRWHSRRAQRSRRWPRTAGRPSRKWRRTTAPSDVAFQCRRYFAKGPTVVCFGAVLFAISCRTPWGHSTTQSSGRW
jgi:hypothetical protein